jgi:hypothetical protein
MLPFSLHRRSSPRGRLRVVGCLILRVGRVGPYSNVDVGQGGGRVSPVVIGGELDVDAAHFAPTEQRDE